MAMMVLMDRAVPTVRWIPSWFFAPQYWAMSTADPALAPRPILLAALQIYDTLLTARQSGGAYKLPHDNGVHSGIHGL